MKEKIYKSNNLKCGMKRGSILVLFVAVFIFIQIVSVAADGGYFPPPGYWVRPGQQRAIIFYEDNTETLILTSGFQGNAKDLVWIVPTPSKPEITKASEEIFTNIAQLARPRYDYGYSYGAIMEVSMGKVAESGVRVIESKQVDYYDVNVLLATSSNDLVKWFNENNYSYPKEYSYVLEHYINKGWYFTAIKVSPEAQGATEVIVDLKEGNPTPVKLTFLSEKVVFPLKISSVDFKPEDEEKYGPASEESIGATRKDKNGNIWTKVDNDTWTTDAARYKWTKWGNMLIDEQPGGINYEPYYYRYKNYIPIQIYVIADGKYEADGNFYIQYGNWVKKSQIEKLGDDENGEALLQPTKKKYFLTAMQASYQKSKMDEDLFLKKADKNKKVNAGLEAWQIFLYGLIIALFLFMGWIFTPLGIMFIAGTLILFFSSNKTARIFGWIMEIFSLVITLTIAVILFIIAIINHSLGNYIIISTLITSLLIIGLMVLFIVLNSRYKKNDRLRR